MHTLTQQKIRALEAEYGITIAIDYTTQSTAYYEIYTADGCRWENGLRPSGVISEVKTWGDSMKHIADIKKGRGAKHE